MKKFLSEQLARLAGIKIPKWALGLMVVAVFFIGVGGWIANIFALADAPTFGGLEMARAAGILAWPVGIILGLFA